MAALAVFSGCNKDERIDADVKAEGIPFSIIARHSTDDDLTQMAVKTSNDGMTTSWADGDAITLFHAPTGGSFVLDGEFTVSDTEKGVFDGTIDAENPVTKGESYDWIAVYPYGSQLKTPANSNEWYTYIGGRSDRAQIQEKTGSTSHLCGTNFPLWGKLDAAECEDESKAPFISMNQVASLVAFNVTNATEADIKVSEILFEATEDIVGSYYINFSGEVPSFTVSRSDYVSNEARLNVTDGTLAAGETGVFYIGVKPFVAHTGSSLKMTVTTAAGDSQEKVFNLSKDFTFAPGKVKKVSMEFTVEHPEEPVTEWVKTDVTKLVDGDVVVVADITSKTAMSNNNGTGSAPAATPITFTANYAKLAEEPAVTLQWTFGTDDNGFTLAKDAKNFLYATATNNGVRVGTNANNIFSISEGFLFNNATERYVGVYNKNDWRCYTSIINNIKDTDIAFYRKTTGSSEPSEPDEPVLTGIEVTTLPSVTTYDKGDTFSFEGAVVTATYSDGSTADVTASCTTDGSTKTSSSGTKTVTVTYEGQTATFTITVNGTPGVIDFSEFDFTGWTQGYLEREVDTDDYTITFSAASKQTGSVAITDIPVSKAGTVAFVLKNEATLTSAVFNLRQWSNKQQKVELKYTTNGGDTWNSFNPAVTLEITRKTEGAKFTISSDAFPEGSNGAMINLTGSDQLGIESISYE